ncbi:MULTISPECIES: hypothetical protein [Streptomyces]|uniref:Uncharacterized protein n=2 Tax=Streptomyces rimosus subsp. rimosus TaxID=132474 RepID=L8EU93_STRR1|nr:MULTISPECIES: hypothetical protein [Streptomyces]KOG84164.1 hypothetical protein ADK78_00795 [Kitasatospora aureofaciens]MYT44919.1 hypothetical protein [Streptomyces sp. SID5471]KOT27948.1 hypothetical protein ADK84_37300 [Streptomyces sp. NRRL WC-3701]KOT42246.1 hypothetical protein ADK42_10065 [Streptomyces rimosus subsp. rimosus]KOT68544.1 hypothetical protein ADK44_00730 [Streptomyces rimosus subsp. rimosus]
MIHAVFNAAGRILRAFDDDDHDTDSRILAERALVKSYGRVPGAYVDAVCPMHREPRSDCEPCETQMACPDCDWPGYTCARHR